MTMTRASVPRVDGEESPPTTVDEFVQAVRHLLANEEPTLARRTAAQGASRFPDDPWLARANRVLNPTRITSRPATAPDRTQEFAWLKRHGRQHRGQWVALLGDELLASGDELSDVLEVVRGRDLKAKPLVHHIE